MADNCFLCVLVFICIVRNGDDCKGWISNIRSLQLRNVNNLNHILPCQFLTRLNEIEFTSLDTLRETRFGKYCDLQTKEFESTQQLAHGMKSINDNASLVKSISNLYLRTAIDVESENSTQERNCYFGAICDILSQWIDDGNKNILLRFTLSNTSDAESDYKYGQEFGVCLCNKIDKNVMMSDDNIINQEDGTSGYVESLLGKGKFVSPYYGGDSKHFHNIFVINNRVRIGIHNPSRGINSGFDFGEPGINRFEFAVQGIKLGDNFEQTGILMPCVCNGGVRYWW